MSNLLEEFVRLVVETARVPQQLLPPDEDNGEVEVGDEVNDDEIKEFSGVGACSGYQAPFGANPDKLGRGKNKKRRS